MIKKQPHLLIVGSQGGLGREIVSLWQGRGFHVTGFDLSQENKGGCNSYLQVDLFDLSPEDIKCWLQKNTFKFDLIIFTAGTGYYGSFEKQLNIRQTISVNFTSQVLLAKLLSDFILTDGQMIFTGSVASHMPTPSYEVYSASKAALESFVRSWRHEVKDVFSVRIFLPGGMKTEFHKTVGFVPDKKLEAKFLSPKTVAKKLLSFTKKKSWRGGYGSTQFLLGLDQVSPSLINYLFSLKKETP